MHVRLRIRPNTTSAATSWARGTYRCDGRGTSWLKIKDPVYRQIQAVTNWSPQSATSGAHATKDDTVPLACLTRSYAVAVCTSCRKGLKRPSTSQAKSLLHLRSLR